MNSTKIRFSDNKFLQLSGDTISLSGTTATYGDLNFNGNVYISGATSGTTSYAVYYNTTTKGLTYGEVTGGHLIYSNNTLQTEQDALNFVNFSIEDEANVGDGNSANKITHTFGDESNVDISGATDGSTIAYNSTTGEWIYLEAEEFRDFISLIETNIDSNKELTIFVKAGYMIDTLFLKEINSEDAGYISVGTTSGATNIVYQEFVGADDFVECPLGSPDWSLTNSTSLFIESTNAFATGVVNVYARVKMI